MRKCSKNKDSGWCWVVVFAAFMVNFLIDGVRYSFGIMIVEWHEEFKGGMTEISWVASLMFGLILIFAPISAALVNKYGCRMVTIAGTLTAFTGFMASVFAKSVFQLYFTFGVMGGLGFSMIFITGYVVVIQYFEKRRSLAIGLAVIGSGSGGLVFNPVSKWLLEQYGWRGTLLIESAILLNGVACGAVMRPVSLATRTTQDNSQNPYIHVTNEEAQNLITTKLSHEHDEVLGTNDLNTTGTYECNKGVSNPHGIDRHSGERSKEITRDMIIERNNSTDFAAKHGTVNKRMSKTHFKIMILKVFRFDLLLKKRFLLFALVGVLINISYMVPFIYVFDMALEMDQPSYKAVWLMTSMSIANVASRIPVGVIADIPRVNTLYMMAFLYISAGIFTGIMPFCNTYELLLCACIMFSASIGMVLIPVVLSKLFGDEVIADAFGLSLLFGGLAGLIGPSLTGALYDWTHGYHAAFLTAGFEFILGGIVLCFIPCFGPRSNNGNSVDT